MESSTTSKLTNFLFECTSIEDMNVLDNGDVVFDFYHPELDKDDSGIQAIIHSEFVSCTDYSSLPSHVDNITKFYIDELLSNQIQMELTIVNN